MYLCIGEKICLWCFVKECEQKKQRENIFTNTLNEQVINDIREYGKEVKEHKGYHIVDVNEMVTIFPKWEKRSTNFLISGKRLRSNLQAT